MLTLGDKNLTVVNISPFHHFSVAGKTRLRINSIPKRKRRKLHLKEKENTFQAFRESGLYKNEYRKTKVKKKPFQKRFH